MNNGAPGLVIVLTTAIGLAACDNMANQPKRLPYEAYRDNPQSVGQWEEPAGTLAREQLPDPPPPPVTLALLERGRQRFDIYCSVCHGLAGYGDGQIVQRGFPPPPSYHIDRLRKADNQHFYDVITHGYGAMFSYAQRVAPPDRWAIVAYIRALQASQNMPAARLSASQRAQLDRPTAPNEREVNPAAHTSANERKVDPSTHLAAVAGQESFGPLLPTRADSP